jgi:secreted trypsin-like serine protease
VTSSTPLGDAYFGQFCSGVIVKPGLALTAAHCVLDRTPGSIYLVVGAQNICDGPPESRIRQVFEIHIHPSYMPRVGGFDVAALVLEGGNGGETNLDIDDVRVNDRVIAMGWGANPWSSTDSCSVGSHVLHVVDAQECASALPSSTVDTSFQFCALPERGQTNTCAGDSGGPVFLGSSSDLRLVGLIVSGPGCGPDDPGSYQEIRPLSGWLASFQMTPTDTRPTP